MQCFCCCCLFVVRFYLCQCVSDCGFCGLVARVDHSSSSGPEKWAPCSLLCRSLVSRKCHPAAQPEPHWHAPDACDVVGLWPPNELFGARIPQFAQEMRSMRESNEICIFNICVRILQSVRTLVDN